MGRNRNNKITIWLTDNEKEHLLSKIKESRLTYSDYFLHLMNNNIIYEFNTYKIDKELSAIGKNINEWTRTINIFNEVNKEDVEKLIEEIRKMKKEVNDLKIIVNTTIEKHKKEREKIK